MLIRSHHPAHTKHFFFRPHKQVWGWVQEMYAFAMAMYQAGLHDIDLIPHMMAQVWTHPVVWRVLPIQQILSIDPSFYPHTFYIHDPPPTAPLGL